MIWILTISACLISLGLNVWLLRLIRERDHEIATQDTGILELVNEINELRPKRDARGRFTR